MVSWGIVATIMAFAPNAGTMYLLRFLLGVAEAGFFPGIILFLTWWFPERQRTPALALFFTAVSVAYVFGGRSPAVCSSSTASPASTAGSGCS